MISFFSFLGSGGNSNARLLVLLVVLEMSLYSTATADKIGINFVGGTPQQGTPAPLKPSEIAGVFPQKSWNNAYEKNGNLSPVGHNEKGSSVSYPGFIVSWDAPATNTSPIAQFHTTAAGTHGPPNYRLGLGYIEAVAGQAVTITFTSIPRQFTAGGHSFSLVVCFHLDNIDFRSQTSSDKVHIFTIKGAKAGGKTICGRQLSGVERPLTGWVQVPEKSTTDEHEKTPAGNYVVFSHLTDTDLILTAKGGSATDKNPQAAINAIQIISSKASE